MLYLVKCAMWMADWPNIRYLTVIKHQIIALYLLSDNGVPLRAENIPNERDPLWYLLSYT
jgi:hypothetical protein